MTQPASVTFDGTDLVLWVPALESIEFPGLSELTDPAVLDMSCYFSDAGWAPALTEAAITDNRLCSSTDFSGPFDEPLAAGDLVRCYAVKLGRQHEAGRTANSPWLIQQQAYLRPPGTTTALVEVASS